MRRNLKNRLHKIEQKTGIAQDGILLYIVTFVSCNPEDSIKCHIYNSSQWGECPQYLELVESNDNTSGIAVFMPKCGECELEG